MAGIDYLGHIEQAAAAFGRCFASAPADRPIAACPGWTAADLAVHLGAVHRWAADVVRRAGQAPEGRAGTFAVPTDTPDLPGWFEEGSAALLATLRSTDRGAPAWSWGADKTVAFWHRRQALETSVHRWDMELDDQKTPIEAGLAADGIDEFQSLFLRPRDGADPIAIELHATDLDRSWRIEFGPGRPHKIEATASDLLLTVWGRRPEAVWSSTVRPV